MEKHNIIRKKNICNTKNSIIDRLLTPPFVSGVFNNGKRWTTPEDVRENRVDTHKRKTVTECNLSSTPPELSNILSTSKPDNIMLYNEINDDNQLHHGTTPQLQLNNNNIDDSIPRKKLKLSFDKLKSIATDTVMTVSASEITKPIRQWNRDSEKIFPIRDPQNPMQILPFLADAQDPTRLSDDVKIIFQHGISVSKRAIDQLKLSSHFKEMSDENIEESLNNHIERIIEQFINNNTNDDIAYYVDIVSKNAEKALQGQQGIFIKKDKIQEGQIVCPFAGVYADKEADFPNEKNYAFQTMKNEYIISPSPSEQAGYAANTAFKLNDDGGLYYNKDGLPQYDSDYINACFVEKWVTFEKDNEDKKIIPMVFIVYLGSQKMHTKNDTLEIRVDYGDDYPQLMCDNQSTTEKSTQRKLHIGLNTMPKTQSPRSIRHSWEENILDIEAYYKTNGNSFKGLQKFNPRLQYFLEAQRVWYQEYEQNNINNSGTDPDQIKFDRLKHINIMDYARKIKPKKFEEYYEIFKEYHAKHGSFDMVSVNLGVTQITYLERLKKWYNQYDPTANNSEEDKEKYEKLKIFHNDMIPFADIKYSELSQYKKEHDSFKNIYKNKQLYRFFNKEISWYHAYDPQVNNSDADKARYKKCQELGFAECDYRSKNPKETYQKNYQNLVLYNKVHNGFKNLNSYNRNLYEYYLREKKWFQTYDSIDNKSDADKARYEKLKKLFD